MNFDEHLEAAAQALARQQPPVRIDLASFRAHIAARAGPDSAELVEAGQLEQLMHSFACMRGDRSALALFYARYEGPLRRVIARTCKDTDEVDDVFHDVIIKLTVARAHAPAGLEGYEGRGKLLTWLRVVAARAAIDHARKGTSARVTESMVEQLEALEIDSEVVERYRHDFKVAVALAVSRLEPRQRQILRYHLAGVSVGDIADLLGHHRVTVSRWLSATRDELREHTLRVLADTDTSLTSLALGDLLAHVSASFDRLLATG
ncbi:sigma-70 family RNA polymerase sigma factor [Enhygromyxa salina]|uniref:RNA polymerase sigma factor n=1 Tax=Enhygromyxa salina TaxID=215803 RepID=A0A2S9YFQ5_9BACT|nr:sigma-70 family RNA polymerase sigma factor [Enhygromyxa salina]PRQ03943.1 RNA polymerase sigma factor [Enhygromyxa salina]